MNKNKILYIDYSRNDFFSINRRINGVHSEQYFQNYHKFIRILKLLPILSIEPLFFKFFDKKWSKTFSKYDVIIIPASYFAPKIVRYIHKTNKNIRIIIWYWNSIEFDYPIYKFQKLNCEIWSFDENDCKKYGLKHNTQYYFPLPIIECAKKYDVLFLGLDKGRAKYIFELKILFEKYGLICSINIVRDHNSTLSADLYSDIIEYSEYVKLIQQSKIILDIVQENQHGSTLRPLEALYFGKKLITNNKNVLYYPYYSSKNVFILGYDTLENLSNFIQTEYDENIRNEHMDFYLFDAWLSRFFIHSPSE